jgi:hypothetical protein
VSLKSAAGEEFFKTLERWLESQSEVLILIRYSRAAGNKNFEFYRFFELLGCQVKSPYRWPGAGWGKFRLFPMTCHF